MMIGFVDYTVKDGLRPMSAEERLAKIRAELASAHPGEVFKVRVWEKHEPAAAETADGAAAGAGEQVAADAAHAEHAAPGTEGHPEHGERHEPTTLDTALHFPSAGDGRVVHPVQRRRARGQAGRRRRHCGGVDRDAERPFGALKVEGKGGFGGATDVGHAHHGQAKS